MEDDKKISTAAHDHIKHHADDLIKKYADPSTYIPVTNPISLFMAGSPGAGKTEVSKSLIKKFKDAPVRIDADEIRKDCPGYTGTQAHLFQAAATKGVNLLFDHALHNSLNLILDGTFAYAFAIENIKRSLNRKRVVEIWFVYQKPTLAWEFTKVREAVESRHIIKDKFIRAFLRSRQNVIEAKKTFGKEVELNILIKNLDNSDGNWHLNVQADEVDRYLKDIYTEEELNILLQ